MRQNVKQAIDTFEGLRIGRVPSITASGDAIYSYATCIATRQWVDGTGRVVINVTKYSATTSQLQAALKREYPNAILVEPLAKGATPQDLRIAAIL